MNEHVCQATMSVFVIEWRFDLMTDRWEGCTTRCEQQIRCLDIVSEFPLLDFDKMSKARKKTSKYALMQQFS